MVVGGLDPVVDLFRFAYNVELRDWARDLHGLRDESGIVQHVIDPAAA